MDYSVRRVLHVELLLSLCVRKTWVWPRTTYSRDTWFTTFNCQYCICSLRLYWLGARALEFVLNKFYAWFQMCSCSLYLIVTRQPLILVLTLLCLHKSMVYIYQIWNSSKCFSCTKNSENGSTLFRRQGSRLNPLVPNSLFFDQIRWNLERALLKV